MIRTLLVALTERHVAFVVIGGVALQLHGSGYQTYDIDVCFEATRENAARIVAALEAFHPRFRDFPKDLPSIVDEQTLLSADITTLSTDAGPIDFIARVPGVGSYPAVFAQSIELSDDSGVRIRVLSIDALIAAKRATNRPKDHAGLLELAALKEARNTAEDAEQNQP